MICAYVSELCVDYYCVPIAVYHHEPSRRKLIVGNKYKIENMVDSYNHTELQHICMCRHRVCIIIFTQLFATNMCTAYQDIVYQTLMYQLENKFQAIHTVINLDRIKKLI